MQIKIIDNEKHIIFLKRHLDYKDFSKLNKAIFYDRDGVLIEECHYISDPINVKILPGVKHRLNISNKAGWLNHYNLINGFPCYIVLGAVLML